MIDSQTDTQSARLDEINTLLGHSEEVQAARQALLTAQAGQRNDQTVANNLELEVGSIDDKTKATETRLYSGTVNNPKELQDMQDELASLSKRHDVLENQLFEAMLALEESQHATSRDQAVLQEMEEAWANSQSGLTGEKQALEIQLAALAGQRAELVNEIDPAALAIYEKLRAQLGGIAVAHIEDGVCSACRVRPTSSSAQKARHGDMDARCATCRRILYDG